MKTAISIDDAVFREAERFAKRSGKSRSQLYTDAVKQYLLAHSPDSVTESWNRVADELDDADRAFISAVSHQTLKRESW